MRTIVITGGTDGIGKGLALHYLKTGDCVVAIGSSNKKGEAFMSEASNLGIGKSALFIQADLSLASENKRIIKELIMRFKKIDVLVFSATFHKFREAPSDTREGFELAFALYYLSRFILSYGLKQQLEGSELPVVINICAPGIGGEVQWNNLQYKNNFKSQKALYHGSRLNDLLGVSFAANDQIEKIRYILFNPWAVQTKGMIEEYKGAFAKRIFGLIFKILGKPVDQAILPIIAVIDNTPKQKISAFIKYKPVSLLKSTFDKGNTRKLYLETNTMISNLA